MVRKFFHNFLLRRHFWRYATFSEVAELYVSRMLRTAALYLVNTFVSIYLYQIGYSIPVIAFFWTGFYLFKAVMALPAARLVAWVGPKRATLISNLLYIPAMITFAFWADEGIWVLVPVFVLQGLSATMYSTAYAVNFSKVKSLQHAGKEIAYMNIFEKITTGISPLVGGFIAYIWGPQVVIALAAILFALAATPLFKTGEQVRVNQKLVFRSFPWKLMFRHSLAQLSHGFDIFTSGIAWSLYIGLIVVGISANNNDVYAVTGVLASVVFVVAIVASYTYGRLIDRRRGGELMKAAAIGSALTHLMRPFAQTPISVAGLNAVHELAVTGYMLPYTRAVFDNADISGSRATYLGFLEVISNLGAALGAFILAMMASMVGEEWALRNFFFIAAGVLLLVLTARFPLYKK